jgi:hypothetical protein
LEEADESLFWLEFSGDNELLFNSRIKELKKEAFELTAIFAKSRLTARENKTK